MNKESIETKAALEVSRILQDTLASMKRKDPPFMTTVKKGGK